MLRTLTLLALLALAAYGIYKAVPLLSGPHITLSSPSDDQSFPGGRVLVAGVARNTENLTLDGSPLLIDEKGHFSTELVLPVGGAILSLTATDRFGKTESVRRTIFVP